MISVYDFSNCQDWLKAYVKASKEQGITLGKLAARLGIGISTLQMLAEGKRKLTVDRLQDFCKKLELSEEEAEHLLNSFLGKPSSRTGKKEKKSSIRELRSLGRDWMSRWFLPSLLVYILDRSAAGAELDFAYLAKMTNWPEKEVRDLYSRLKDRGIIEVGKGGQFHLVADKMSANFSKQSFLRELLKEVDAKIQSDFSHPDFYVDSHALALSEELYKEYRKAQKALVKEFLSKAEDLDPRKNRVYQIFISSFPAL